MKRVHIIIIVVVIGLLMVAAGIYILFSVRSDSSDPLQKIPMEPASQSDTQEKETQPKEDYKGESVSIGDTFKVIVPGGWTASVSSNQSFLAILFARPQALHSLVYDSTKPPTIDYDGIPSWSGLTEHFYIRAVNPAQSFNPANHQEVSSEEFIFNDGSVGKKYLVLKHAAEAEQYGGLLTGEEWQGRVYVYEKDGQRIEAHLAVYPDSEYSIDFFESVARTVSTN